MSVKSFGQEPAEPLNHAEELHKLVGCAFPVKITTVSSELVAVEYETEWKEGGTSPIKNKKGEIVDYKEDYTDMKLTDKQIKKIDAYIADRIETA